MNSRPLSTTWEAIIGLLRGKAGPDKLVKYKRRRE